jgi:hypothetical protein
MMNCDANTHASNATIMSLILPKLNSFYSPRTIFVNAENFELIDDVISK